MVNFGMQIGWPTPESLRKRQPEAATVHPLKAATRPVGGAGGQEHLKLLAFGNGQVRFAANVGLTAQLVKALQSEFNPDDRAGIAEILGKAGVADRETLNALMKVSEDFGNTALWTASVRALGEIVATMDPDSHARVPVGRHLMALYEQRGTELEAFAAQEHQPDSAEEVIRYQVLKEAEIPKLFNELAQIARAIGKTGTPETSRFLAENYTAVMETLEQLEARTQRFRISLERAEEKFKRELQREHNGRPFEEIVKSLSPDDLETMMSEMEVVLPEGERGARLDVLRGLHEAETDASVLRNILLGLMDGLAAQGDIRAVNLLRNTVLLNNPQVSAKGFNLLAPLGALDYREYILPRLSTPIDASRPAESYELRRKAIQALLLSKEPAAKEKLMEYLSPAKYFQDIGPADSFADFYRDVDNYTQLLMNIVERGDEYVDALCRLSISKDIEPESRKMALMLMALMFDKDFKPKQSNHTLMRAAKFIETVAEMPMGRHEKVREDLSNFAVGLMVALRKPDGIAEALKRVDDPGGYLPLEEKENLLYAVFEALQHAHDEIRRDDHAPSKEGLHRFSVPKRLQHTLLDLIQGSAAQVSSGSRRRAAEPLLNPEYVAQYRDALGPRYLSLLNGTGSDALGRLNGIRNGDPLDPKSGAYKRDVPDTEFIKLLKPHLDRFIRPVLLTQVEDRDVEGSIATRALAARILGYLQDTGSVETLMDVMREPFKGKHSKWHLKLSHLRGTPSVDAAILRLNIATALGHIGDARAVDVMLGLAEDPVLQYYVLQEPMGQLGEDVNRQNDPAVMKRVHDTLARVMKNPDNSRWMRAVRIGAANSLMQYEGGAEVIKRFLATNKDPNFRRHVASALISNNYALEPDHADHKLVADLLLPGLGVERLHAKGITGKGVEIAIVDAGYVYEDNPEGFQDRVILPPNGLEETEHTHPTMVATTAAANGAIKGVAPEATIYSDKWPDFPSEDLDGYAGAHTDRYKKLIAGKIRGQNNIRVINNSWGLSDNDSIMHQPVRTRLKEFKRIVDVAERAGIVFVFSAGNEGEGLTIPGLGTLGVYGIDIDKLTAEEQADLNYVLDKVILVGASNTQGRRRTASHRLAPFSSRGDKLNPRLKPTLVAPGVDMMVYSYDNGQLSKELVNGTSFSGPYVSGLVALMLQVNPSLTPAEVRDILRKTARKLPDLDETEQGAGEVNPQEAVATARRYRLEAAQAGKQARKG